MKVVALLIASVVALLPAAPAAPHIVVFLSDGHGQADSSVYGGAVATPHMERIAAQGMTFTRAYSGSPSSVPARAVLMTGLMPARNGAIANEIGIAGDVHTLPSVLARAGYRCVRTGMDDLKPPTSYGHFEVVAGEREGGEKPVLVPQALDAFLADRDPADQRPLFLLVSSRRPAAPWPQAAGIDPAGIALPPTQVDTPETRAFRARYLTDVARLDEELGQVFDLVRHHLGDDVFFLYTSTHGPQFPFAADNLYDAGIRVPFFAVWPGKVAAGARNPALLSHADVAPTLIEIADGRTPADLDGRSFVKSLTKGTKHRDGLFATHTAHAPHNVYPTRSFRDETHKLIVNLHPTFLHTSAIDLGGEDDGRAYWESWIGAATVDPSAAAIVQHYRVRPEVELYDLVGDPAETRNLALLPESADTVKKMRARLNAWMVGQGDRRTVIGEAKLIERAAPVAPGETSAGE